MRFRFLSLLVLLFLLPGMSAAETGQADNLGRVVTALERPFRAKAPAAEAIRDFQGTFIQESHLVSLDRTQRGNGRLAVKLLPPDTANRRMTLFAWHYEEPEKQAIVSNGRDLWVYLPENRQAIYSKIDPEAQGGPGDPMSFLTGLGNLSRDFTIEWADPARDPAGNFVLELTPRESSPLIQGLRFVVAREAVAKSGPSGPDRPVFPLLAVTVFDPSGNMTLIEFHDIQVNRGLPDAHFEFTVPAGVEIVRPAPSGLN